MDGPLARFFAADHRRLDALLRRSVEAGRVDPAPFAEFRAGILRHIGMEEKLLLPAARRARGGAPLAMAAALRVDHGAIAALLVPTPTPALVADLLSVLGPHNRAEEAPGGIYDLCDQLLAAEAEPLLARLAAFPVPPLAPHNDSARALSHAAQELARFRRQRA